MEEKTITISGISKARGRIELVGGMKKFAGISWGEEGESCRRQELVVGRWVAIGRKKECPPGRPEL